MWDFRTDFDEFTLTSKSIDQRARIALYRALNMGRVVGFIGAGVSVAYGRGDWGQMVDDARKRIVKNAEKFLEQIEKAKVDSRSEKKYISPSRQRLDTLLESIKNLTQENVEGNAERWMLILELCDSLAKEIEAQKSFRQDIAKFTINDRAFTDDNLVLRLKALDQFYAALGLPDNEQTSSSNPEPSSKHDDHQDSVIHKIFPIRHAVYRTEVQLGFIKIVKTLAQQAGDQQSIDLLTILEKWCTERKKAKTSWLPIDRRSFVGINR